MKIAGSSRKDGMTLYGPHYKVNVTVPEPGADPVIEVKKHHGGETVSKTKEIPVLRGMTSLLLNNGVMAAVLGMQALIEIQEARGKKHTLLSLASLGLSGYLVYSIAGNVNELRKFHGAEHKVIGTQDQGLPNDLEHVRMTSRISDRCGTNFIGFYVPAQLISALIPIPSETVKALIGMGLAYEAFKLDREKYGKYVAPFYKLGALAQKHLTTAEPDEAHLKAGMAAMDALLEVEKGYVAENGTAKPVTQ